VAARTPLDHFKNARKKFDAAGLTIYGYCYNMNASFTDAELERGFEITKAIGAEVMTTSTTMDVARRLAPLADKHKVIVGLHGHSNITIRTSSHAGKLRGGDEDVALSEGQPRHRSLWAADYDPIAYIREHHAKITNST